MKPLKLDEVRKVLPNLEELRPVMDLLVARSSPDPGRAWAASGSLGTVGERLVAADALAGTAEELAAEEHDHLKGIYVAVSRAIASLGEGDGLAAAEAFLVAAAQEEQRDRPERAAAYAAAAHRVARDERDQRVASVALRRWARADRARGRLEEARLRYEEAHGIARDMFDAQGAAEAAIGAGNVLEQQGDWTESEAWYRRALDSLSQGVEPGPERWHAQLNIHIALRSRGALDESLPWLRRAEETAATLGDESAEPFLQNAWGQLYLWSGSFREAEEHLRRALTRAPGAVASATIRLNLAEALLAQGRTLEAAEEAREAERATLRAGGVVKLPEVYRLLGRIATRESNQDAFVLFERALEIVRDRGLPDFEEALTLQAYAEAEAYRGEEDTARRLHEAAKQRFAALGITHMRHPWTDVYGPGSESTEAEVADHPANDHE
jgi:tetratricopeptide (TPR) repeat protein